MSIKTTPNPSTQILRLFPELTKSFSAARTVLQSKGRFAFYGYLKAVYRAYRRWSQKRIKKQRSRTLARLIGIDNQPNLHPFRIIIEATFPSLEAKMASRWTRALEFAAAEDILVSDLPNFFKEAGGVAACARHAADEIPRRKAIRSSWI